MLDRFSSTSSAQTAVRDQLLKRSHETEIDCVCAVRRSEQTSGARLKARVMLSVVTESSGPKTLRDAAARRG